MALPGSNDIKDCIATGASKQTNISFQTILNLGMHYQVAKFLGQNCPDVASWASREQEFREIVQTYLMDALHGIKPPQSGYSHDDKTSPVNGVYITKAQSTKRHDSQLANTSWFDLDMPLCVKQYPRPADSQRIIDILEREERRKINDWRNQSNCSLLIVRRSTCDEAESDWRTDLTLEIIGRIRNENEANQQYMPILAHFCKQNAEKKNWAEIGFMIQDFISQLLRSLRTEDSRAAEGPGQPSVRSHEIMEDSTELWNHLVKCILHSQAKTVFVLIDNITWMFDKTEKSDFIGFFKRLEWVCQELEGFGRATKVMVTCSRISPEVEECFSNHEISKLALEQPSSKRLPEGAS